MGVAKLVVDENMVQVELARKHNVPSSTIEFLLLDI